MEPDRVEYEQEPESASVIAGPWHDSGGSRIRAWNEAADAMYGVHPDDLRWLIGGIPAATYVDDPDGRPLYVSPQIQLVFGCTREEWMASSDFWLTRVHPDERAQTARWYAAHVDSGVPLAHEYRIVCPDGSIRWIHDRVAVMRGRDGAVIATHGVLLDITDTRVAEQRLRERDAQVQRLLSKLMRAEEDERQRIAGELHDDTIQAMTAALIALECCLRDEPAGRPQQRLEKARDTLRTAIDRTRRLTFDLRPPVLEHDGLEGAIQSLVHEATRAGGLQVSCSIVSSRYDHEVEEQVYRVVRQSLTNVVNHARATRVAIAIAEREGALDVTLTDDGIGFDVSAALSDHRPEPHFGIAMMAERVQLGGGSLELRSQPGKGTTVSFTLPLRIVGGG